MLMDIHQIRNEIPRAEREVQQAQARLDGLRRQLEVERRACRHQWDDSNGKPNHITHPAVSWDGDPPGTMGVDRQLPGWSPERVERRWTRTCSVCGLQQHSTKSKLVEVGGDFR